MVNTKITLCGLELDNPIIPASGTFGYGYEFAELYDINILGSFSFKGTTLEPRFGNPTPRIAECASGLLNCVGLQNPGVRAVIARELPRLAAVFNKPVIANVCGFSPEEYAETARLLDACPQVGLLEINISCPNVHAGGLAFGSTPQGADEITRAVRRVCKKPVFIKLSPNVTDIGEIALACKNAGCDGLSLINTLVGMRIDLKTRRPILSNRTGGLSGPGLFAAALARVWEVYEKTRLPIIGMGGVSCARDVLEMLLAGAAAVGVGSANLVNPFAARDIINDLPAAMEEYGVQRLSDIIGGAH